MPRSDDDDRDAPPPMRGRPARPIPILPLALGLVLLGGAVVVGGVALFWTRDEPGPPPEHRLDRITEIEAKMGRAAHRARDEAGGPGPAGAAPPGPPARRSGPPPADDPDD
jgi:hypothetical protein